MNKGMLEVLFQINSIIVFVNYTVLGASCNCFFRFLLSLCWRLSCKQQSKLGIKIALKKTDKIMPIKNI